MTEEDWRRKKEEEEERKAFRRDLRAEMVKKAGKIGSFIEKIGSLGY
jgi:hypothetical protein